MGECKKDVTPVLTHWSYLFFALTHWYAVTSAEQNHQVREFYPWYFFNSEVIIHQDTDWALGPVNISVVVLGLRKV